MAARRTWTVTPHGPIEKIDDNLWAVSSPVPGLGSHRRMSIVRRTDGALLFYNAVPMDERSLDEIRAWGIPRFLVVTHDQHMIDGDAFRQRLGLAVHCPSVSIDKVRARTEVTGTIDDLPPDPSCRWDAAVGTKTNEPVLFVRSGGERVSMVTSDVFQNNAAAATPLMFRLMGFVGPRTPPLYKLLFVKDKPALRAAMERWARTPDLARIVPSHGDVVDTDPAGVLHRAAAAL